MSQDMKVVIDCSKAGAPSAEFIEGLKGEALDALSAGNSALAEEIMSSVREASSAAQDPAVQYLPLDEEELKQREEDAAAGKEQTIAFARIERNALLAASDWTQVNDTPLDSAKQREWQAYRQALRDVDFSSDEIDWPVAPDG